MRGKLPDGATAGGAVIPAVRYSAVEGFPMNAEIPLRAAATATLASVSTAASPALERLVPLVYQELREMAQRHLGREHGNVTIQTTELVHEAYLRLVDSERVTRQGRAYFFGAAARAMRQVLIEAARRRGAQKRGGGEAPVTLNDDLVAVDAYASELLDLDRALSELERVNPRHARVVECRYFGGLSVDEAAEALDISPRTVKSDWALARAWLYAALRDAPAGGTA
jgi:RNA polymerase sigma-70 factor, ECF subfamily